VKIFFIYPIFENVPSKIYLLYFLILYHLLCGVFLTISKSPSFQFFNRWILGLVVFVPFSYPFVYSYLSPSDVFVCYIFNLNYISNSLTFVIYIYPIILFQKLTNETHSRDEILTQCSVTNLKVISNIFKSIRFSVIKN